VKWNLRMAAARRDIWKSSQLQAMLADAGLVISAGKMSYLWSGRPVTIRLDDLDVICAVLGCEISELLEPEPPAAREDTASGTAALPLAAGDKHAMRRRPGRQAPPV
jgi:DNA-binding Xre family transcriptional regulator